MYVVTGASGRLGRLTLRHLVERVDAAKVVALTRTPDKVAVRAGEPGNPLTPAPEHRATERLLARSGAPFTVLRNNIYPDVLLELAPLREAVNNGVLGGISAISGTSGEGDIGYLGSLGSLGYVGYVAREDCAAVGAALLAEGGHTGEYLDVTGPYVAITEGEGGKGSRRRGGRLDAPTCEGQCAPASSRPS
ncbi:hypothetical protein [Streptomyces noursei]|uniref:hypothetical protein n=1 Tax=Streptomyces noursei TaxID=1971 RepID=UPI0030F2154F